VGIDQTPGGFGGAAIGYQNHGQEEKGGPAQRVFRIAPGIPLAYGTSKVKAFFKENKNYFARFSIKRALVMLIFAVYNGESDC
jgi:hypothetical protein